MANNTVDFNCLDFFKEEIRHESAAIKIKAVNRLNLIASALGPAKTAGELIPFVIQIVREEPYNSDEEFLYSMAKQYAVISDYNNGKDELLMEPLEMLAAKEETLIREQAIASFNHIVKRQPQLGPEFLVPAANRLATQNDFFTARVSACGIIPIAYKYASQDQKPALRKLFSTLCSDDTPMVRRAAANKLRELILVCDIPDLIADMIPIYRQLSQEETQDTIRAACVHTTIVIANMLNVEDNRQHATFFVKDAAEDRSWRVRLTVAKNFDQLC